MLSPQLEQVEVPGRRDRLAREEDGEYGDDHAQQMLLEILEIVWILSHCGMGGVSSTKST